MEWPQWWDWDLMFTPHVELRMEERGFTELKLRRMLDRAEGVRPGRVEGRFEVSTRHTGRPCVVILEPDEQERVLYVVTAFPENRP